MATLKIQKVSESVSVLSKMQEYKIVFQGSQKKDVRVPISFEALITFWQDAPHFEAIFAPVYKQ